MLVQGAAITPAPLKGEGWGGGDFVRVDIRGATNVARPPPKSSPSRGEDF
jgi:hypothetical protein